MGQPGFSLNFGKLAIEDLKLQKMDSFGSTSKDKFRPSFSKTPKVKSSIPRMDDNEASDLSDPYSDSDSEANNIKNVTRWLESLPTDQDWYEIEDDLSNYQGDFEKGTASNVESLPKIAMKDDHASQTSSTSFQKNKPTTFRNQKNANHKFLKPKVPKYKNSLGKMQSEKLNVQFKETVTKIRSENSKSAKLLRKDSQLENTDSKNFSTSDECNEDKIKIRKCPYNLRSLDSSKAEKKNEASDSEEKYKRKSIGNSSANNQAKRNEGLFPVEELKPVRKLKSPFTKQATSARFTGMPCMSSYKLNELKEAKPEQKLDGEKGKQKYVDRKVIVKSRLTRSKKLLQAVKDLVNVIDSNVDAVATEIRREPRSRHELIENLELMQRNNDLGRGKKTLKELKQKPRYINSKLEKKLDFSMEEALNRYKRTHETWDEIGNKESSVLLEQPPKKRKKKPVF